MQSIFTRNYAYCVTLHVCTIASDCARFIYSYNASMVASQLCVYVYTGCCLLVINLPLYQYCNIGIGIGIACLGHI